MGPWDGEINHLPNIPDLPIGPVYGQPTVSYSFTFSTTDPDNDKVSFYVDWGNGETSGWTDLINSGQQIVLWHEWNSEEAYSITVKARDEHGAESIFSEPLIINIEEPTQNNPPNTPNTPSGPTNGEIDITYLFSTNSTDPDNDHIKYGWDWNGDNIADEWTNYFQSGQTCSKSKSWINAGTYQIKVKAKDEHNVESQWSEQLIITIEETTENNPPNTPNTPTGPNTGEVGVTYEFNTSTTDPDNDNVKYGWDWNGDKIVDDWTNLGSDDTLIAITHFWENTGTYNISVKAEDEHENQSSFSSNLTITITEDNSNDPPNQPEIPVGPTTGEIEIDYEYTFTATDQENDNISYYIDWGDGNFSGWTEYQYSGEPINLTHIWSNKGTYNIRVKAKDENESIWSENLTVTISEPSVPKPKLEITIDTGISLKKITTTIKNTGNLQANKVNYTINLKYGIFEREKNPSKEYETLNVSTTQTMEIDELWGIGSIELTATAKAENADTVTYEATGIILGRLVIIFGKL